jgi:choice-of-anchor A domain-containing protein
MVTDKPVRSDRSATPTGRCRSHGVSTGESAPSAKLHRTDRPGLGGLTLVALTLGSLAASAPAQAFNLGPAQGYNLFVLGDMEQHYSDVEGRVAVGGNLTLTDFEIGLKAPTSSSDPNLVVGGSLTFNRGTIHGSTIYGQSAALTQVTPSTVTQQDSSAFFSAAGPALNAISMGLKGLQGSSVSAQYDGLTLQGTHSQLNVFNLSNIDWSGVRYLNIDAPSTSQVLVNIAGQSVKWQNMGFGLNGVAQSEVLYNLYEATRLEANGVGIQGSVLAAGADFVGYNGQYNGQGIFKTVLTPAHQASIQGNLVLNDGVDPMSGAGGNTVPTPSLLGGLVSLGLAAWRKRHQGAAA